MPTVPGGGDSTGAGPGRSVEARSAGRGALALLASQTMGRLLGMGFLVVVARAVTPAEFGRYSIATGVVTVAAFAADLGTSTAITKTIAKRADEPARLLSSTLLLSVGLGCLAATGTPAFAVISYAEPIRTDVVIAATALPGMAMVTSVLAAFDGAGLIAVRARVTLSQLIVMSVGGATPVALGLGIRSAVVAFAVSPYVGMAIATMLSRSRGLWRGDVRPRRSTSMALLRKAAPYAVLGGLAILYRRFDVVLLSLLATPAETANYDISLRIIEALGFLGSVVSAPTLFLLSRRLADGDREGAQRALELAVKAVYLVGLPVSALLVGLHAEVTSAALGPAYAASLPLAILGAQYWLDLVSMVQGAVMLSGDQMSKAIKTSAALMALLVCLDLALIPVYGAVGAAMAIVIFQVINFCAIRRLNFRTTGLLTPLLPLVPTIAALACGTTAFLAARAGLPTLASGVIGILVYAMGIALTRFVNHDDVALLRNLRVCSDSCCC